VSSELHYYALFDSIITFYTQLYCFISVAVVTVVSIVWS